MISSAAAVFTSSTLAAATCAMACVAAHALESTSTVDDAHDEANLTGHMYAPYSVTVAHKCVPVLLTAYDVGV